jgi:hypothetical protein
MLQKKVGKKQEQEVTRSGFKPFPWRNLGKSGQSVGHGVLTGYHVRAHSFHIQKLDVGATVKHGKWSSRKSCCNH